MVKVFEELFPPGTCDNKTAGYYMDNILKSNLDVAKKAVTEDWDMLFVTDGVEGGGKSVITQQIAYYCDPTLTLKRVVFRADDFKQAVLDAKPYQAIIFDEAYGGLGSRKTMSATNKCLVDMLTEIRQKNLFIFIVLPSFFDLDKYVALWRSRCLIHVYADKFQRGFFNFYNYQKKKDMYVQGKKFYNYKCQQPNFSGRFTNFYPLNKKQYKKMKAESLRAYAPVEEEKACSEKSMRTNVMREAAINLYTQEEIKLTKEQIGRMLGIGRTTLFRYLKQENAVPRTAYRE